jgi:hypothetical protein
MLGLGKRRRQLLFFSRGTGRGHAIVDAAIANELGRLEPKLDVAFVSYDVGAATLKDLGQDVIDLEFSDDKPFWETMLRIAPLLQGQHPALVVSHEEFCVPPLCKAFGLPVVSLADRFTNSDSPEMQALRYADRVICLGDRGVYDEPPCLAGEVTYLGCVIRLLECEGFDEAGSRHALGIPPEATVVLVCPGGSEMHSEACAPLFDLVLKAYDALGFEEKRLIWIAGLADHDSFVEKSAQRGDLMILKPHYNFIPTLMTCDLVISKGNLRVLLECEALRIPTISISSSPDALDDLRASRIQTNVALRAGG